MVDYIRVEDAIDRPGLRLVVTRGVAGPWGEAAKGIFHLKGIPYDRVEQVGGEENAALKAWTGTNSAPVAVYEHEPPRDHWLQILLLAERLQPRPVLIPECPAERALMLGMATELCSEDGYGWNRRLLFYAGWRAAIATAADPAALGQPSLDRMSAKYGQGRETEDARQRIIQIVGFFGQHLRAQHAAGSRYFIGDQLTALDIYWACFCAMIKPLPIELCPMTEAMHAAYAEQDPEILAAVDPILLEHRDEIYRRHLELPLRL